MQNSHRKLSPRLIFFAIGFLLLASVGFWMVLYATVWGAGWVADSYQYIGAARNLAQKGILAYPGSGNSLIPLTHYPPAFSVVLAAFEWVGWDAYITVRYFHAFLFGLSIILVGITTLRITHCPWSGLFASLLTLFSAPLLERHAWAMSEPLFLTLILSGFLLVDVFYKTDRRLYLILTLFCLAIAWLTRYIGVVAIITLALILTVLRQPGWKALLINLGLTTVICGVPMLLWAFRNFQIENQFLNRQLTFTPLGMKNWLSIVQTLMGWLLPGRVIYGREKWLVIGAGLFFLLVLAWWWYEAKKKGISPIQALRPIPLVVIYILFGMLYVPFVILSKLFFDPAIGFTERMLIPTQLSVIILVSAFLSFLWKSRKWLGKVIGTGMALLLLFYYTNESFSRLQTLHKQGLGVANRRWHESQVIQTLQTLETNQLYSNSLSTMYLWTGEAGWYFTELADESMVINEYPAYLVVFHYLKPNARLQRLMEQLKVYKEDRIATIYIIPSNGLTR
jgi:hypothetical protein